MTKRILLLFIAFVASWSAQAQIKKYYPKSPRDGFLRTWEVGVGGFYSQIKDKQYSNSAMSDSYGLDLSLRYKMNDYAFIDVGASISTTENDRKMLGNNTYSNTYLGFFPNSIYDKDFKDKNNKETYIDDITQFYFSYSSTQVRFSFGRYVIGSQNSRFAFAPVCPTIGVMLYNASFNYVFETTNGAHDFNHSSAILQLMNKSTLQLRLNRVNIFAEVLFFASMSREQSIKFPIFEPFYKPQIAGYSGIFGVRYHL
ncbi:MAG: hypothetical protein N4A45_05980 [Flavobacteriales bacterium]|jgi:hypothetical protein|nr:hypothetical protein [Flavobacteriales bacterium]